MSLNKNSYISKINAFNNISCSLKIMIEITVMKIIKIMNHINNNKNNNIKLFLLPKYIQSLNPNHKLKNSIKIDIFKHFLQ
jgi:hypothetical protein